MPDGCVPTNMALWRVDRESMKRERDRKERLNRNIYSFEKVIQEKYIIEVAFTQHIPNWYVRWCSRGA